MNKPLVFLAPLLVLACGGGGGDAAPAPSGKPSASPSAAEAAAPASGAPSAAASAAPAAASAGGFATIAEGDGIVIYPAGGVAVVDTGAFVTLLGDGPLVQDPVFTKTAGTTSSGAPSLSVAKRFTSYAGSGPAQLLAFDAGAVFARVNDTWVAQSFLRDGESLRDLAPWDDGRALAAITMAEPDLRFQLVNSKSGAIVPGPGKPTPEQEGCAVRMDPGSPLKLAGLATGHLFAIGLECKTKKAIAERWEPKKVRGEAAVIEGIGDGAAPGLVAAAAPDDATAIFAQGGKTFVASWDGKAWKAAESPFGAATQLFASSDGATWATAEKGLFKHPKGGAWAKVEAPGAVTSAWAKDDKTLWIVVDKSKLMQKTDAPQKAVKLPSRSAAQEVLDRDRRWMATPFCKGVYVMLATLGPSGGAAPTSNAGLTNAVKDNAELKGLTYIVEDNGANMFVGAKVPSVEVGEKLITAYKAANAKASPEMFCHDPIVKAPLKVE